MLVITLLCNGCHKKKNALHKKKVTKKSRGSAHTCLGQARSQERKANFEGASGKSRTRGWRLGTRPV